MRGMLGALDVLVVDDRPETISFLVEFLLQRCRRVDVADGAREAVKSVARRRAAREPYHLVISDLAMPGGDGLSLLRELRQRQDDTPFVLMTAFRGMHPGIDAEAARLGMLAVLDKPIDLRAVEAVLDRSVTTARQRRSQAAGDEPFFGTSRTMRRSEAPAERGAAAAAPPSPALERRVPGPPSGAAPGRAPAGGGQPPAGQGQPPAAPAAGLSTTNRVRRSVDPVPRPPVAPVTTFTARARRSLDGTDRVRRDAPPTESARQVACAMCNGIFVVADRAHAYTTVCVHCGALATIQPDG